MPCFRNGLRCLYAMLATNYYLLIKDSTSLVLPVKALKNNNFQLTFENPLSFEPSQLVSIIDSAFQKQNFPIIISWKPLLAKRKRLPIVFKF